MQYMVGKVVCKTDSETDDENAVENRNRLNVQQFFKIDFSTFLMVWNSKNRPAPADYSDMFVLAKSTHKSDT